MTARLALAQPSASFFPEFYAMAIEYYELTRRKFKDASGFQIASAAIMECGLCGRTISGSGGPGDGAICIPCGDVVKSGQARAAIQWGDDDKKS